MSNNKNKNKNKNKRNNTVKKKSKINKKHLIVVLSCVAFVVLVIASALIIAANKTTEVYIDFTVDGKIVYSGEVTVKGINPTVLRAVEVFADNNGIEYTYDDEKKPTTIRDFGEYSEYKDEDAGLWYFWEFGLNDITVYDITGRASNNKITNGDEIHWYFSSIELVY